MAAPQQRRSVFVILDEMQQRVKDLQAENKQLKSGLQDLRRQVKDEKIKYFNTQALIEVRDGMRFWFHTIVFRNYDFSLHIHFTTAARFDVKKLQNDCDDLKRILEEKEMEAETTQQVTVCVPIFNY